MIFHHRLQRFLVDIFCVLRERTTASMADDFAVVILLESDRFLHPGRNHGRGAILRTSGLTLYQTFCARRRLAQASVRRFHLSRSQTSGPVARALFRGSARSRPADVSETVCQLRSVPRKSWRQSPASECTLPLAHRIAAIFDIDPCAGGDPPPTKTMPVLTVGFIARRA